MTVYQPTHQDLTLKSKNHHYYFKNQVFLVSLKHYALAGNPEYTGYKSDRSSVIY